MEVVESWRSQSEEETVRLGSDFAKRYLRAGTVVCVRGELGAGKTHFIKGIARALGIEERELTSPTFALAHEFELPPQGAFPGVRALYHLDCYRFEKPEELLQLGIEDYLYPKHAATIVEWPERIASFVPTGSIDVAIEVISENERVILLTKQ